jgi:hypothetical protein
LADLNSHYNEKTFKFLTKRYIFENLSQKAYFIRGLKIQKIRKKKIFLAKNEKKVTFLDILKLKYIKI